MEVPIKVKYYTQKSESMVIKMPIKLKCLTYSNGVVLILFKESEISKTLINIKLTKEIMQQLLMGPQVHVILELSKLRLAYIKNCPYLKMLHQHLDIEVLMKYFIELCRIN